MFYIVLTAIVVIPFILKTMHIDMCESVCRGEMTQRHTNNQIQRKLNNYGAKYGKQENSKKAEWKSNNGKELEGYKEGPKAKINIDSLRTTLKKYQIKKHRAMMAYTDSGSKNSPHLWQTSYRNESIPTRSKHHQRDVQWNNHIDKKKTPSKEPPETTTEPYRAHLWCRKYYCTNKRRDLRLPNKLRIVP